MLNFTAIDFETANSSRGSPCAVGLVRVRDGKVVDEQNWLIRPFGKVGHFDPFNVSLHGITPEMVADAPRFNSVLPKLVNYVGSDILVAHNAAFDVGVVRDACTVEDQTCPSFRFLCTLVASRRTLSLPSYRLPFVAEALGLSLSNHHDALADAISAAEIAIRLADLHAADSVETLAKAAAVRIGTVKGSDYQGSMATQTHGSGVLVHPQVNKQADPDGQLYGRVIVFTGALQSMTRQEAQMAAAQVGAIPEENVTKRTNILVLGDFNPILLRPGENLSGKARKAFDLHDKGQDIEVVLEDDFLRCLDGVASSALA
ncbi:MAG: exonuclease domain-containing protein [Micrococcales bacterium]|nr:exonuclease domain-containing protein [Micrococcales bacterium]